MLKPGTLIDWKWHETVEGKEAFSSFFYQRHPSSSSSSLHPHSYYQNKRRVFGLLERPLLPPSINAQEVKYKICVVGKAGVGKSATVANLCGHRIPNSHADTPGLQVNTTYWLTRLKHTQNVLLFQLQFWEAGESSAKRFDHVLPACKDKSDAILFLFSHVNKNSLVELPQLMSRIIDDEDDDVCRLVMGTKFDLLHQGQVSTQDIQAFESRYKVPVMRIKNAPPAPSSSSSGVFTEDASGGVGNQGPVGGSTLGEIFGLMNAICEQLWLRDQILAGVIGGTQDLPAEV